MTLIVGLTGGIGSGKTAVSDRFEQRGITIIDADVASRVVVEPGRPALAQITEHFGENILQPDGSLDRAALRAEIFSKPEQKHWLESLLHPLIGEEIFSQLCAATSPYVLFVSPLLIEAKQTAMCDQIIVVDVPEAVQIERTMARDNNDKEQVEAIMASQTSREQRLAYADEIIENWHGFEALDNTIDELHQHFLRLAEIKASSEKASSGEQTV
jgi:dephospho-CoA kinase